MDSDGDLRCNNHKCRRLLESSSSAKNKIVVTLCSHVFCLPCAQEALGRALVCPACNTALSSEDEVIVNNLSPTDEWKSLVLAGLRPETVVEVCSRALNLYTYQTSQERAFLENTCHKLDERVRTQDSNLQQQLHQAVAESTALREKTNTYQKQREHDKQRLHDATEAYNEKNRQLQKLQKMYDSLKRRIPMSAGPSVNGSVVANASASGNGAQGSTASSSAWLPGLPSDGGGAGNSSSNRASLFPNHSHRPDTLAAFQQSLQPYAHNPGGRQGHHQGSQHRQ